MSTDRILSQMDVDLLEEIVGADTKTALNRNFLRLIASHRLLQEMVKQYERMIDEGLGPEDLRQEIIRD